MNRFIWHFIGFCVSFGLALLVMIHGWGLEPQSWAWIIWGSIGSAFVGALVMLGGEG